MNIFARYRVSMIKTVSGRAVHKHHQQHQKLTTTQHNRQSMIAQAHYQMSQKTRMANIIMSISSNRINLMSEIMKIEQKSRR